MSRTDDGLNDAGPKIRPSGHICKIGCVAPPKPFYCRTARIERLESELSTAVAAREAAERQVETMVGLKDYDLVRADLVESDRKKRLAEAKLEAAEVRSAALMAFLREQHWHTEAECSYQVEEDGALVCDQHTNLLDAIEERGGTEQ